LERRRGAAADNQAGDGSSAETRLTRRRSPWPPRACRGGRGGAPVPIEDAGCTDAELLEGAARVIPRHNDENQNLCIRLQRLLRRAGDWVLT
jgi:hypothetical protein